MSFQNVNEFTTTLNAVMASGSNSFTTVSNGLDPLPTTSAKGANEIMLLELEDGGVTQAEPELILFAGKFSGTLGSVQKRGFAGTTSPAGGWPIGTNVNLVNRAELFDLIGLHSMGYPYLVEGHINGTPGAVGANGIRFYANGSALPSQVDALSIDVDPGGWDMSNYLAYFAAGDLVRMKWLTYDLGGGAGVAGGEIGIQEVRFEAEIDTGGLTDQTSRWEIDILQSSAQFSSELPDTSNGIQGHVLFDILKMV